MSLSEKAYVHQPLNRSECESEYAHTEGQKIDIKPKPKAVVILELSKWPNRNVKSFQNNKIKICVGFFYFLSCLTDPVMFLIHHTHRNRVVTD